MNIPERLPERMVARGNTADIGMWRLLMGFISPQRFLGHKPSYIICRVENNQLVEKEYVRGE